MTTVSFIKAISKMFLKCNDFGDKLLMEVMDSHLSRSGNVFYFYQASIKSGNIWYGFV